MKKVYGYILGGWALLASPLALAAVVDNGDGTVTDTSTSLMWVQNADLVGSSWWPAASVVVDNLTLAGHDDWRMPTIEELEALNAALSDSGAFNPLPFVNLDVDSFSDWFWSSTENPTGIQPSYPSSPQGIDYFYFDFEFGTQGARTSVYQAFSSLPVRDTTGACDVVDNGDGTVTDRSTGLMWLQNASTITQDYWAGSVTAATNLNVGGYNDWRLAEITELEALYAKLSSSGVFVPSPFVNLEVDGMTDWYWSSTDTGAADYFYFDFELGVRGVRTNTYQALYGLPTRMAGAPCQ